MFDFRIINATDGNQIIDPSLKTPYDSLTLSEMIQYIEIDKHMAIMDRMERKRQKAEEHQRKLEKNPLYRIACMCGIM